MVLSFKNRAPPNKGDFVKLNHNYPVWADVSQKDLDAVLVVTSYDSYTHTVYAVVHDAYKDGTPKDFVSILSGDVLSFSLWRDSLIPANPVATTTFVPKYRF